MLCHTAMRYLVTKHTLGQVGETLLGPLFFNISNYGYSAFNTYILLLYCIPIVEMVPTKDRSCGTYQTLQSLSVVQQVGWCRL